MNSAVLETLLKENNELLKQISNSLHNIEQHLSKGELNMKTEIKGYDLLLWLNRGGYGDNLKQE